MLTVKQFADKIGLSRQRVHQLMLEGRVSPKPKKIGSYFLVACNARITRALTSSK